MRLLIILLVVLAQGLRFLSRIIGKGRGTSITGWVVEKYCPWVLRYYSGKYSKVVYITGTNGKTTTRSLVTSALTASGSRVVSNVGGANIYRGIAASLLLDTTLMGRVRSEKAVFEVEEATLPNLVKHLPASILVITNLARDQLDVYGELDVTLRYFQTALTALPRVQLVLNADDTKLAELDARAVYGVQVRGSRVEYESGVPCATYNSILTVSADKTTTTIKNNNTEMSFSHKLPGQYNSMNYGLASAALLLLDTSTTSIEKSFSSVSPIFGRMELLKTLNTAHTLALVKNPLGFHSSMGSLPTVQKTIAILVNDKIADGADVSWLWDVNFENYLKKHGITKVYTSGSRGLDISLRIQQAARTDDLAIEAVLLSESDLRTLLLSTHEPVFIFATYTAMMSLRRNLEKTLSLPHFDQE